jgi:hypothetical protein
MLFTGTATYDLATRMEASAIAAGRNTFEDWLSSDKIPGMLCS